MSKELLDEILEQIDEEEQESFAVIIDNVLAYGFIEDVDLAELFELELDELDDILRDPECLKVKVWKSYCRKLKSYLKKERNKYTRLYYKDK